MCIHTYGVCVCAYTHIYVDIRTCHPEIYIYIYAVAKSTAGNLALASVPNSQVRSCTKYSSICALALSKKVYIHV